MSAGKALSRRGDKGVGNTMLCHFARLRVQIVRELEVCFEYETIA
jgi:hypothetical protein